ncbi:MAG: beta-lactamase family protein, partial [Chloroflexi bacterium]|nr:beta-lactamase family protein [Chloroflexota bacterium]
MKARAVNRGQQAPDIRPLCCILLVLTLLIADPRSVRADRIDRYIQGQMKLHQIPGLSLAVLKNGKVIKERGYGLANVELGVPVTPETGFEIGSITKPFTA